MSEQAVQLCGLNSSFSKHFKLTVRVCTACLRVYHVNTGALKGQKEGRVPSAPQLPGVGNDPGPLQSSECS